jgi:hypothetical protein
LLDRTLIWNQRHLRDPLRQFEIFYNEHRPHQGIANARPLAPLPEPITNSDRLAHLTIHRRDRLGGVLHEYQHAACADRMSLSAGTRSAILSVPLNGSCSFRGSPSARRTFRSPVTLIRHPTG